MKVLVSAPCNNITGYGNDTLELVRALLQWGADVYVAPSAVHPPIPRDVAATLTKSIPSHVDLAISHRCPQELANVRQSGLYAGATVALAWTMWEFDSLDIVDALSETNCEHSFRVRDHLRSELSRFDGVLAYDEVSKQALLPYHDNITVLQGGVDALPAANRDWFSSPFRFLSAGVLTGRKNPFATITAFKNLRDAGELQDTELILKTTHPGLHPAMEQWCPGLKIIEEVWPEEKLYDLYRMCHVLISTSWGEGKNRPAIQFATSGGAVIAPNVGGHAQWMSSDFAWPLDYTWKEFASGANGSCASVEHLSELMLWMYNNRSQTKEKALRATRILPLMVSWHRVLERLMYALPSVAGRRGDEVSSLMRACRRSVSPSSDQAAVLSALDTVA